MREVMQKKTERLKEGSSPDLLNIKEVSTMYHKEFSYADKGKKALCSLVGSSVLPGNIACPIGYKDLNSRGVRIMLPISLPPSSTIRVRIVTNEAGVVIVKGRVCWCAKSQGGWQAGVTFEE